MRASTVVSAIVCAVIFCALGQMAHAAAESAPEADARLAQLAKCCADTVSAYSESPMLRRTRELKGRLLVELPAADMDWLNDAARRFAQSDPVDWARLVRSIQVLRAAQPDPRTAALADTILGIERGAVLSETQFRCLRGAVYLLASASRPLFLAAPLDVIRPPGYTITMYSAKGKWGLHACGTDS
ncbi:MAG: hypothetical protein JXR94_10760 [Candidatus Hydrogenedentes bacterium]|nr:hypothetical protein [Candidatus Hydrogenedentota bacterium]